MRRLPTARLWLEPLAAEHAAEMFSVLSDPAIYAFEGEPPPSRAWLEARYLRLQSRASADGAERWLNWVVRRRGAALIGFVQATVLADGRAWIGYQFASRHWHRGFATEAVAAMLDELAAADAVQQVLAVFEQRNLRSRALLQRLGFAAPAPGAAVPAVAVDERLMVRTLRPARSVADSTTASPARPSDH